MFEDTVELVVLACLMLDIAVTVLLAVVANKWHRKYEFLRVESSLLTKKAKILQTSNDIFKETVKDLKNRNLEVNLKRAELLRQNKELSDKLSHTQKKLSSFSKLISDMKNS